MSATLDGHLTPFGEAKTVVLRFFTPTAGAEQFRSCAALDASGNFTITGIPAGTWDVGIKADGSMTKWKANEVFTDGATTTIDFGTPLYGDINGDDVCDGWDYSAVLANQGKFGDAFMAGIRDSDWIIPSDACAPCVAAGGVATKFNRGLN